MTMLEKRQTHAVAASVPGEPMLQIAVNDRVLSFPVRIARPMLFHLIPEWLRDSSVEPPKPDTKAAKQGLDKGLLEFMRSSIKNLVRLKLRTFMQAIYGPDQERWPPGVKLPKGREDILPVIDQMMIDFLVTQAFMHPLVIEFDEQTGLVTGFRLGQRIVPPADAGNTTGAPGQTGAGNTQGQA